MRVLYVFRSLAVWGGIERILVEKMNYLKRTYGYDIAMITTDQGGHVVPFELATGIHLEDLGISFYRQYRYSGLQRLWTHISMNLRFRRLLRRHISKINPDIIVCVATSHAVAVIKAIRHSSARHVPVVVESHSICRRTFETDSMLKKFASWQLKRHLRKTDVIVALTDGDAREWRLLHPCVKVIANMAHLHHGNKSSQTSKHVIFVGRLDYQKRVMEAIAIWRLVQPTHPDWVLDIYGEGDDRENAVIAAQQYGLHITVHRPTAGIFKCYTESALLICTSLFEPFGLILPEAMSCGLPVVAYDCPFGPAAIITDGEDGFLVENNDRQAFAERMTRLMDSQLLRQQMGANAIRNSQRYAAENIMPQWKQLFEGLSKNPV